MHKIKRLELLQLPRWMNKERERKVLFFISPKVYIDKKYRELLIKYSYIYFMTKNLCFNKEPLNFIP